MLPVIVSTIFLLLLIFLSQGNTASAGSLTFSGTIVTPSGTPYTDGGGVNLFNATNGYGTGINLDGTFTVSSITPGEYSLDISISGSSPYANPAQQQVTITSDVSGFRVQLATPTIIGTLAKPDGTPTNGCVNLHDSTWTINRNSCPSSDGQFKIGGLAAGTYIFSTEVPDNSPYVGTDQIITITSPSTTMDLGTVMFENPFVVGLVALPDGTPLVWNDDWNQRLHLSVDLWNSDRTVDKHSTFDNQSKFKFGRMPAGTYTVHVNIWDTELYTGSENVTITVPASGLDITGVPIRLTTPQLSGIISRADGTPIQNAWVNVRNSDGSLWANSNTDANGKYRIGGLPAGTYLMEVGPPQEITDVVRTDPMEVTLTSSLQTKNVTLTAASKFVTGTVKRPDGSAVACAQVNANRRGGNGWANTQTASDGTFKLTLQPGSWSIRVEQMNNFGCPAANWIYTDPEALVEFSDSTATETQTVALKVQKATASISGTVKKKDGSLVTQGNINANSQSQDGRNRWSNAQIGSDGKFKLLLVGGTYELNVWTNDPRLFTKNQRVSVSDGQALTVDFTMGEKLAHITGTVTTKAGVPLPNMQLNGNLDCGPDGCAAWSNTTTSADGTFDMAATPGHWYINFDSGRGQAYVYDGPQKDVYISSETATVANVDFALTYADVSISGKIVDESGTPFSDFSGWAYLRPLNVTADTGFREYGAPVEQGSFSFRVPSSVYSQAELGVHTPQNSQYSSPTGQTITLVADATIQKNIVVKKNDAAIVGKIVDASGLPLRSCNFSGEVFANTPNAWFGTRVNPDCTYEISLLAGTYMIGYHFEESAGFLNRPLQNSQVTIAAGSRVQFDIKTLAGDSRVSVLLLEPDGTPVRRGWVNADNHEEIDLQRRAAEQQTSQQEESFKGPGGTRSPKELFAYCSKPENKQECQDFKLPAGSEGPGGCKDALACTQYCQKNAKECEKAISGDPSTKQSKAVESHSLSVRRSSIAPLKLVQATAEEKAADTSDSFANMINTSNETKDNGVATLVVLSGHCYTFNAGIPPESSLMPPRNQTLCIDEGQKSADLTMTLRKADGRMSGFVTWNKVAVRNGWIGCWSEDGNSNGSQIINGTYSMNYASNTTYHCDANASDGTKFLRSGEQTVTVGTEKTLRKNFTLGESTFDIPPPVSECFDATQPHVITLADGTTVNLPANTIASSGTVCVSANPTINVQSQSTARPLGYAYSLEAKDENNKTVSTFNTSITISFNYTQEQLTEAGVDEDSLVPSYWDSASSTWKKPSNITQQRIKDSADGKTGTITTTTNHFTAYAVVSSGGKAGRSLTEVKTTRGRDNVTTVVVGTGKKAVKFKPFAKYKGDVDLRTLNVGGKTGQIILAVPTGAGADPTVIKVFSLKGKLIRSLKLWAGYKSGARLAVDDVTGDGRDDLFSVPQKGTTAFVVQFSNWKSYALRASNGSVSLLGNPVDLLNRGNRQIAMRAGNSLQTWRFEGGKFKKFSYDTNRLRVQNDAIERVRLNPTVTSLSTTVLTAGKGLKTITIKGQNFGNGSMILLNGTIPARRVEAKGDTILNVTIDLSKLKPKKTYNVKVINADGQSMTLNKGLRTK